ncbi:phage tail fiber protein [Commensalibacter communis]|uniref:phage tail fiber protein n=1 Tax=Commensalibacter communis TaxID=2972786 RepID=UPI0022FF9224|nr:hypothetical protein [Commensalibacter communis]CAI3933368.1 unnamed protein product [Commensalibacter communis]CAI3944833.1 unnamed protein product [Commensalibacter communis]
MAAKRTITGVNTKLSLIFVNPWANTTLTDAASSVSTVAGTVVNATSSLLGVPLELEALTSDNPFTFTQQHMVDTQVSIEGNMYGGFLASAMNVELTATFIAASDSLATLQQIAQIMATQRETVKVSGTMILPSQQKTYSLNDGYWINYQQIPSHGTVLQPVQAVFRFTSAILVTSS